MNNQIQYNVIGSRRFKTKVNTDVSNEIRLFIIIPKKLSNRIYDFNSADFVTEYEIGQLLGGN